MHTDPSGTDPSTEMIRMLFSMLAFYAPGFNSQHSGAPQRFTHHGQRLCPRSSWLLLPKYDAPEMPKNAIDKKRMRRVMKRINGMSKEFKEQSEANKLDLIDRKWGQSTAFTPESVSRRVVGRGQGLFSRIGLISWCDNVLNGYFHESNNHRRRAWHSADAHHG